MGYISRAQVFMGAHLLWTWSNCDVSCRFIFIINHSSRGYCNGGSCACVELGVLWETCSFPFYCKPKTSKKKKTSEQLTWRLFNLSMHQKHLEGSLELQVPPQFSFSKSRVDVRAWIADTVPGLIIV